MKQVHILPLIVLVLPTYLLIACSGNTTAIAGEDNITNTSVTGRPGDDLYYELITTTTSTRKDFNINGITKIFVSLKGDVRKEMDMANFFAGKAHSSEIIVIAHPDKPGESIILDNTQKTYTINPLDRADINTGIKPESTVTRIGNEKIFGFNCVHARIISTETLPAFSSHTDTFDIWKSNEVPMPPAFKQMMDKFEPKTETLIYSTRVADQLKQMGCEGFMVKIQVKGKNASTTTELTKVEHKAIPAGMFEIPAGYIEDKKGM